LSLVKNRILVFAHDASLYGAAQSLLTLLEELSRNKLVEFFVILPHKGKMEEALKLHGITYKVLDVPRCFTWNHSKNVFQKINHIIHYKIKVRDMMPHLVKITNEFQPDLVYSNTSIISIGSVLARKRHLPHVWHVREFGDLDYNFEYLPGRKQVIKHMQDSSHVIFVSKSLQKHWYGDDTGNSSVVYNGLVSAGCSDRKYPVHGFRFGILGAIVPGKGQAVAVKAMSMLAKKYPGITLNLFGNVVDKEYQKEIEESVRVSGCSGSIIFKAFEEDQDLIYSNLDVLLNCSVMEGFGRTIVEAMNRGIPVIANASGGPLEIIEHNQNGLLYRHSAESLAVCMENLMEDESLYERISQKGAKDSMNYSVKTYTDKVFAILKNALPVHSTNKI
jgi:glycosyltransferase involved in cell wall biosynthesis